MFLSSASSVTAFSLYSQSFYHQLHNNETSSVDKNHVWAAEMYDLFHNVPIPGNTPTPPYRMDILIKDAPLAEVRVIYPSLSNKRSVDDATIENKNVV